MCVLLLNATAIYKTFWAISHKNVLNLMVNHGASSPAVAIATTISPSWYVFGLMPLFQDTTDLVWQ